MKINQEDTLLSCTQTLFTVGTAIVRSGLSGTCIITELAVDCKSGIQLTIFATSNPTTPASNWDPQLKKLKYSLQPARLCFCA